MTPKNWDEDPRFKDGDIYAGTRDTVNLARGLNASSRSDQAQTLGKAKRDVKKIRYDLLDPAFLYALAQIANYGAEHYGDGNWKKSRLTGEKGPINHIYEHLGNYQSEANYDHPEIGSRRMYHLAAIAFNAMIEFYYEDHETK